MNTISAQIQQIYTQQKLHQAYNKISENQWQKKIIKVIRNKNTNIL